MSCSSTCITQDHASLGACLRDKGVKVAYANSANNFDYTGQKRFDRDLDAYAAAKAQGVQPATTNRKDVDQAMILSDLAGSAFQAA